MRYTTYVTQDLTVFVAELVGSKQVSVQEDLMALVEDLMALVKDLTVGCVITTGR